MVEVRLDLQALLDKRAFDKSGYGMEHAVSIRRPMSPRCLHGMVEKLSLEKGRMEEYQLYARARGYWASGRCRGRIGQCGLLLRVYHILNCPGA